MSEPQNEQRGAPVNFKQISPAEFEALDSASKDQMVKSRHQGDLVACEAIITAQLIDAMTKDRQTPTGEILPPYKHDQIAVVVMHRDDPMMPREIANKCIQQNIQLVPNIVIREEIAKSLLEFTVEGGRKPYQRAGYILSTPSPPETLWFVVFDLGMCTVTFMGFDPHNPDRLLVPIDPNHLPPPPVAPLPLADKRPVKSGG